MYESYTWDDNSDLESEQSTEILFRTGLAGRKASFCQLESELERVYKIFPT